MRQLDPETEEWYLTCDRCGAEPIIFVYSPSASVELCLEHGKPWFPSVEWWEDQHRPLADHLGDALARAYKAQLA